MGFMEYGKQTKLAQIVDVTPQLINQIMSGKRRTGYDTAKKIARLAGVSVEDIMDATPDQIEKIFSSIEID
jgi:DNA-binding XRE family transcriptional regulator